MRIAPAFRLVLFNSRLGNFQAQRRPAGHLGDNGGFLSKPPLGNHLIWLYANSILEILDTMQFLSKMEVNRRFIFHYVHSTWYDQVGLQIRGAGTN